MPNKTFKLVIAKEGTETSYLHTEAMKNGRDVKKEVRRVSDVEFDHGQQVWYATLMNGREIARDPSRDRVLEIEREVIEGMLTRGEIIP